MSISKIKKGLLVATTALTATILCTAAGAQDFSEHRAVLGVAETITHPDSGEAGSITIFRNDVGNGQLSHDFVYGDPRRMAVINGGNPGVTFAVNTGFTSADGNLMNQISWLYESINSWNNTQCSNANVTENAVAPGQPGFVESFFTGIPAPLPVADLTQVGFRSGVEFPYFAANPSVLGVTFTLFWEDAEGNLTDIDSNGKIDVALREIYYNDDYSWSDSDAVPAGNVDFPTVAIHEVGHGFSVAHFGLIGVQKGALVARPRSIMNAIYGGKLRELHGRDKGSNCSNWAQWPNN